MEAGMEACPVLKGREKACEQKEKKKKPKAETKEIKPSILPGSLPNLFFCLARLTLREGAAGAAGAPWCAGARPAEPG